MIHPTIRLLFAVSVLLFIYDSSPAQDTLSNSLQQKLENLAENSGNEETDYSALTEHLEHYRKHPVNLNNTSSTRLSELGLLNNIQIENLLRHIDKNGKLISLYELQSIEGFDLQTIEQLFPYITLTETTGSAHASLNNILHEANHELLARFQQILEKQKGFSAIDSAGICRNPNSRYIGSPQKIYARYRFTYGNSLSAGITAEKDPGELFFRNNTKYSYPYYDSLLRGKQQNGFDFYSAHLFIKNIRFIRAFAIGDYQVGFGQGLTACTGLAYGKNTDAMAVMRNENGLRAYTSADENRFLRGCAITVGRDRLQASGFCSRKKMDANAIFSDSTGELITVSSLQETGLHATPGGIAGRDVLTQTILGGNISYRERKYTLGLTAMHTDFNVPVHNTAETYNQFNFQGDRLYNIGADYSVLLRNFNFFGETSVSSGSGKYPEGIAYLHGCNISLDPKLSLAVLHRNFQRSFQNLNANPFAENSGPSNEQGLYIGVHAKPVHSLSIHAYHDRFTFPWLRYRVNAPSHGNECMIQVNYMPSKKLDTYISIRQKDKSMNTSSAGSIDFAEHYTQLNYRWHISYRIFPSLKLSNRVECITVKQGTEKKGFLVYQDAAFRKKGSKITLTLRYALFDTPDFSSRIYTYENDMPGSYSIPSYYHKGNRVYLMMSWNITGSLELWLRWSQTYYSNQNVISAGSLNEIQGHSKNEVKAQVRLRL